MCLVKAGTYIFHRFYEHGPTLHRWCQIHQDLMPEDITQQLEGLPFCLPYTRRVENLILQGNAINQDASPAGKLAKAKLAGQAERARAALLAAGGGPAP